MSMLSREETVNLIWASGEISESNCDRLDKSDEAQRQRIAELEQNNLTAMRHLYPDSGLINPVELASRALREIGDQQQRIAELEAYSDTLYAALNVFVNRQAEDRNSARTAMANYTGYKSERAREAMASEEDKSGKMG